MLKDSLIVIGFAILSGLAALFWLKEFRPTHVPPKPKIEEVLSTPTPAPPPDPAFESRAELSKDDAVKLKTFLCRWSVTVWTRSTSAVELASKIKSVADDRGDVAKTQDVGDRLLRYCLDGELEGTMSAPIGGHFSADHPQWIVNYHDIKPGDDEPQEHTFLMEKSAEQNWLILKNADRPIGPENCRSYNHAVPRILVCENVGEQAGLFVADFRNGLNEKAFFDYPGCAFEKTLEHLVISAGSVLVVFHHTVEGVDRQAGLFQFNWSETEGMTIDPKFQNAYASMIEDCKDEEKADEKPK